MMSQLEELRRNFKRINRFLSLTQVPPSPHTVCHLLGRTITTVWSPSLSQSQLTLESIVTTTIKTDRGARPERRKKRQPPQKKRDVEEGGGRRKICNKQQSYHQMAISLKPSMHAPAFSSSFAINSSSRRSNLFYKQAIAAWSFRIRRNFDIFRVRFSRSIVRYNDNDDGDNYDDDGDDDAEDWSFEGAVELFNRREYYRCHDALEALWIRAEEPTRTLIHGILQCAVGFHHLFNHNHKGAMMELGEGLCKLRKMNFENGPFYQFEKDISAVLDFIYQTQIEHAACTDDICLAMDQSERSYQLLGSYAAGENVYHLESVINSDGKSETMFIVFSPSGYYASAKPPSAKLPVLDAREEDLIAFIEDVSF